MPGLVYQPQIKPPETENQREGRGQRDRERVEKCYFCGTVGLHSCVANVKPSPAVNPASNASDEVEEKIKEIRYRYLKWINLSDIPVTDARFMTDIYELVALARKGTR
jgi:hypothetical protein